MRNQNSIQMNWNSVPFPEEKMLFLKTEAHVEKSRQGLWENHTFMEMQMLMVSFRYSQNKLRNKNNYLW